MIPNKINDNKKNMDYIWKIKKWKGVKLKNIYNLIDYLK